MSLYQRARNRTSLLKTKGKYRSNILHSLQYEHTIATSCVTVALQAVLTDINHCQLTVGNATKSSIQMVCHKTTRKQCVEFGGSLKKGCYLKACMTFIRNYRKFNSGDYGKQYLTRHGSTGRSRRHEGDGTGPLLRVIVSVVYLQRQIVTASKVMYFLQRELNWKYAALHEVIPIIISVLNGASGSFTARRELYAGCIQRSGTPV